MYTPDEKEYLFKPHEGFSTKAIHAAQAPEPVHGSVNVPIHLSTTFAQKGAGEPYSEFDYTRCGNPTRDCLEKCLATLEYGKHCITFSSGCAGLIAITHLLSTGDHMICCDDVYGGTQRYLRNFTDKNFKIDVTFVNLQDLEKVKSTIKPQTKLMWIETPTNPTMKLCDIEELCKMCKQNNIISVVDNTFATPVLQSPLLMGADICINSGSKYLGGHSDVIFGSLTTSDSELHNKLFFAAKSIGGCPSIFDCWLVQRSLKTLEMRVVTATKNAFIIAKFLDQHELVEKVNYPGLPNNSEHQLCKKQMRGSGAMLSFYLKGGLEETKKCVKAFKIATLAESLGGVESLVEIPSVMTHGSVPPEVRKQIGVTDNLIRYSVGVESIKDLIEDIDQALKASQK